MINIPFSEQDIQSIKSLRHHHPHPRVRQRMEVLWFKYQGLPHYQICQLANISSNTLRSYLMMFQSGGIEKLTQLNFYTPTSELELYRDQLAAHFHQHPPATINEAMATIAALTGLKRSPGTVGRFIKVLGLARRKVGALPAKADPKIQEDFRIKELEPRIAQARQGKRAIFLSMLPILSSPLFWAFSGHLPGCSSRPLLGGGAATCSAP